MYRYALEKLYAWKEKKNRKPLILQGARQVGKTYLMIEFGKTNFVDYVYLNFDNNDQLKTLFDSNFDLNRIISGLELYSGKKIIPNQTLIIFDEIQESPKALASLKYFSEFASEYYIVCAGSLLGIALHSGTSFPVGKVDFIKIFPLSFKEFMLATIPNRYVELLEKKDYQLITSFKDIYIDALKQYYFIGGMPEVVSSFALNRDYNEVREIQKRILLAYEQDFSKHAPNEIVPKIRMIWNSVSSQLAKENKKFLYGLIKEGARAKEFETALMWLSDCGLIHQVYRVNQPSLPLKAFEDLKAFKIYLLDVGLLTCMNGLSANTIINGNEIFNQFKGALTEQFALQQLITQDINIYYYTNERSSAEINFVIDDGEHIIPLEVKAETNLKAKSLKLFIEKYQPKYALRCSLSNYKVEELLINYPLYLL